MTTTITDVRTRCAASGLVFLVLAGGYTMSGAQVPPPAPAAVPAQGAGGGRGRGGGLPGATPEQLQAVGGMNASLATLIAAVTTARNELAAVTFAEPRNAAGIAPAVEKVRAAELALAMGRASEFAKLQAGPNRLNAEQVTALIAAGGVVAAGRGGAPTGTVVPAGGVPPGTGRAGRGN